jgi:hypothetical protein
METVNYGCNKFYETGPQKKIWKKCPIFQKVAQTVSKPTKKQIIYNKTQFERPKYLHESLQHTLF